MIRFLCQLMIPLLLLQVPVSEYARLYQDMEWRMPPEKVEQVSYVETLDEIQNPGIGFYTPLYVHYLTEGNEVNLYTDHLVHMRLLVCDRNCYTLLIPP